VAAENPGQAEGAERSSPDATTLSELVHRGSKECHAPGGPLQNLERSNFFVDRFIAGFTVGAIK
jgi:hypothetical protein